MKFKFEFGDEGVLLETNCTMAHMLTAITVEIRKIYESLEDEARKLFKEVIKHMVETGMCFMTDEEVKEGLPKKALEMLLDLLGGSNGEVN